MSDPRLDPNAPEYDPAYAQEQEQSQPSGEQDATLPGETPETSTQIPKEGETTSAGGKSPLRFDPNAPAVPRVADPNQMRVEGQLDEGRTPQQQIYSSAIAPERDPEKAYQEHLQDAANALYPRLRQGGDYLIGRKTVEGDVELLAGHDNVDWGKIEEHARRLSGQDPYGAGYKPKPGLHSPQSSGVEQGEKPHSNYELPGNVAQSEVNPTTQDKVPSQAYPPPPPDPNA